MFITVTCPKCGRGIKAKKKFVLSSGGVPCLKCKIRIPVSKEQVEAYSETPESPAVTAPAPSVAVSTPPPEPVAAPSSATVELTPEPEPEPDSAPEPEPPAPVVVSEPAPPAAEPPPTAAGPHVMFVCPQCQTSYPLRQGLAGKKIRCKSCARIVRVAPDAPPIAGPAEPAAPETTAAGPAAEAGPPAAAAEEVEHLPVVFSPLHGAEHNAEESAETPTPEPAAETVVAPESIPHGSNAMDIIAELRKDLADAEERANSAELTVQQLSREKASSEVGSMRRIRELDAQVRDLTARMKVKEEEFRSSGGLKRAEVVALLQSLNTALDESLQQEISARQAAIDDLKKQLAQALPV